jgi:hypothetical protein
MMYAKINVGFAYLIGLQIITFAVGTTRNFLGTNAIINSTTVVIWNYKREIEFSCNHKLVCIEK